MKNKGTLNRVLKYIKKYTPKLVLSVIFAAVTSLLALYIPILVGNAIDMAVSAGNVDMAGIAREIVKIAVCIIAVIVSQLRALCETTPYAKSSPCRFHTSSLTRRERSSAK